MTFRAKAIALNIPIGSLNCSHNHTMSKHKATLESIGDHFLVKKSYEVLKSIKIEQSESESVIPTPYSISYILLCFNACL